MAGQTPLEVHLVDLCKTGARLRGKVNLTAGASGTLSFDGLELLTTVVEIRGTEVMGVRFTPASGQQDRLDAFIDRQEQQRRAA